MICAFNKILIKFEEISASKAGERAATIPLNFPPDEKSINKTKTSKQKGPTLMRMNSQSMAAVSLTTSAEGCHKEI